MTGRYRLPVIFPLDLFLGRMGIKVAEDAGFLGNRRAVSVVPDDGGGAEQDYVEVGGEKRRVDGVGLLQVLGVEHEQLGGLPQELDDLQRVLLREALSSCEKNTQIVPRLAQDRISRWRAAMRLSLTSVGSPGAGPKKRESDAIIRPQASRERSFAVELKHRPKAKAMSCPSSAHVRRGDLLADG
jgi:hypothetical protein